MPRRGRGYRNQPARASAQGQDFGEAAAQLRGQAVMPLPQEPRPEDQIAPAPGTPGPLPGAPQARPGAAQPEDPVATVMAALAAQGAAPGLARTSERPGEPVTAGLPIGPGPGPEAIGNGRQRASNRAVEGFEALALATGDTGMLRLAALARAVTNGRGRR